MGLGRDPGAAVGQDFDFRLREGRAQHHGVADDTDVGAVAVDDDLFNVVHGLVVGHQLVEDLARQHVAALDAVFHRQVASLPRGKVVVGVGVPRQEQPVPGPGMGLNGLGQVGHVGLCLGVRQRTRDKVLLYVHNNIQNHSDSSCF